MADSEAGRDFVYTLDEDPKGGYTIVRNLDTETVREWRGLGIDELRAIHTLLGRKLG